MCVSSQDQDLTGSWTAVKDADGSFVGLDRGEYQLRLADDFCFDAAVPRRRLLDEHHITRPPRPPPREVSLLTRHPGELYTEIRSRDNSALHARMASDLEASSQGRQLQPASLQGCTSTSCIVAASRAEDPSPSPPPSSFALSGSSRPTVLQDVKTIQPVAFSSDVIHLIRWAVVPNMGEWTRIILPVTSLALEIYLINAREEGAFAAELSSELPPEAECATAACAPSANEDRVMVGFHRRVDLLREANLVDGNGRPDSKRCAVIQGASGNVAFVGDTVSIQQVHPCACTLHPAPCALRPALHRAPCTLHPAPEFTPKTYHSEQLPPEAACPFDLYVWVPVSDSSRACTFGLKALLGTEPATAWLCT